MSQTQHPAGAQQARRDRTYLGLISAAVVFFAVWLPRGLALDRFVTPDEPKWLARSGNFYLALSQGDLGDTFTREHPGVTVTWAGTAGLLWCYPAYPQDAPGRLTDSRQIEPVLREHGKQPVEMLEAGRVFMVLAITLILSLSFVQLVRLAGLLPALAGSLLVAFDPFHAGLSRLLHLDGLASSLMLLSVLAFLGYLYRGRRLFNLVLSGLAAGLGWLTKSPAFFLAPFIALLAFGDLARGFYLRRSLNSSDLWKAAWPLAVWLLVGWAVFILLWPAMWVAPLATLQKVFAEANTYAAEGHSTEVFFNGMSITGDPGKRFYPVSYLWRTTPVVLVGLGLAGILSFIRRRSPAERSPRWLAAGLVLFAALFAVFMTLGSKKFDRYLLPIYAPLDIVAGIGWVMAARWLGERFRPAAARLAVPGLLFVPLAGQALGLVQTYPYYLSYYNPLMGGSARAPEVMMIGWGEGIDQAARYLNAKPGAASSKVISWYPDGVFSYFYFGETLHAASEWEQTLPLVAGADYVVTYIHQWQRGLPFPEMLDLLSGLTPEHVITLNGIEYVRIYNRSAISQALEAETGASDQPGAKDIASGAPPEDRVADVLAVDVTGDPGAYRFTVEVSSPDQGCQAYADWWEVIDAQGELVYRRVLLHSHAGEQPFARSGGPVPIAPDQQVWVRAHFHPSGYGGAAFQGSVLDGFVPAELDPEFASGLAGEPPLPSGCDF